MTGGTTHLGGQNDGLSIASNVVRSRGVGVVFVQIGFIDRFPLPSSNVVVRDNDVRSAASAGIVAQPASPVNSLISANTNSGNFANGMSLVSDGTGAPENNSVTGYLVNDNGASGRARCW